MEQWKQIPGYEGIYDASNTGEIRSTPGKTTSNALYERRVWETRILRQKITENKKGRVDARVCLWKDGKEHTHLVSRLVALAWCDGYEKGLTVNHIDGNPLNNNASNLEWVTFAENIHHAFRTGLNQCNTRVVLVNESTGERNEFLSMSLASQWLGKNKGYLSSVRSKGLTIQSATGERYRAEGM